MNRIVMEPDEIAADGVAWLTDARAEHIRTILHAEVGQIISTGTINGYAGVSRIMEVSPAGVRLETNHTTAAPEPWVDMILAVPRPRVLKRLYAQLATLGVGRLFLLNAAKVEKCYFGTQWLTPEAYRPLLIEGLMQGGTTRLPEVNVCRRFRPFVEDELEDLFATQPDRYVAHPGAATSVAWHGPARPVVAVGPEGGWTDAERVALAAHGFRDFALGDRILRTDTACVALLAVLNHCRTA